MVTDEMVEKAADEMARQDITFANCDRGWQKRTIRAALEAALSAAEPVNTAFEVASKHIPEARVSLLSRAIRQGLNDYGWKNFGTLPEVLMGYIVQAERAEAEAHPKQPAPSVAVKALQMADETFRDLGWHDKYEATTAALAALSAQVQDADEQRTETCQRCQGNGEIVTDWERYRHPHDNDAGDEAVAECPDCDGIGKVSAQVQDAAEYEYRLVTKEGREYARLNATTDEEAQAINDNNFAGRLKVERRVVPEWEAVAAPAKQEGSHD